jgi:aminoglycoside phosphotransferase (APT) family kinase protein
MSVWTAEFVVDESLARRLIGGQFPDVDLASMRLLGAGWDNTVWLVDEHLIFRFPRRAIAIPGIERQVALLPRLAPLLPVPVAAPVYVGRPAEGYRWPFSGSELVPGRELCEAQFDDATRVALARPLARFLRAVHSAHVDGAETLPVDFNGRADMSIRVPRTAEQLAEVEELGLWRRPPGLDELLEAAAALPPPAAPTLVHGDLHVRHVLVDEDGTFAGVIDWDDVCLADPCIDLTLVVSYFPPEGRAEFLAEYGPVGDEQLLRARVLALSLCGALAAYARHEGLHDLEREAVAGLERAAGTEP